MANGKTPASMLVDTFDLIFNENSKGLRQDVTIDAEIKSIKNPDSGEYKVEYQGNLFSAFSQTLLDTYKPGERVYVLVPQGDYSGKKIILGRSSYTSMRASKELSALQNFYVDQGPNWAQMYQQNAADDELQICACPKDKIAELVNDANYGYCSFIRETGMAPKTVYKTPILSGQEIQDFNTQMNNWSTFYNYIKISADFRTEFSNTHTIGEYFLEVVFLQINPKYQPDPSKDNYNDKEFNLLPFRLGFNNFNGSPYGSVIQTPQKAYFKIPDGSSIAGIYSIGLFQNGEFKFDVPIRYDPVRESYEDRINYRNNIYCSNIDIRFCDKVNLSDNLYHPWIETPKGNFVYDSKDTSSPGIQAVDLIAHLQFKDVDLTTQSNCFVRWFRQKPDVVASSVDPQEEKDVYGQTYYYYGGNGWYPIEKIIEDSTPGEENYKIDGNKLTVYKNAVPYKYKYKAVICVMEEDQISSNDGSSNTVQVYRELNKVSTIAEVIRFDSEYDLEIHKYGLGNDGLYHIINKNDKDYVPWEWFGTWFVEGDDESYERISTELLKGKIDLSPFMLNRNETFYAMAYDPHIVSKKSDDTSAVPGDHQEIGVVELAIETSKISESYLTWQGQDTFYYDANGGRRDNLDGKEYTLKPIVHFPEGKAADYKMNIYAPDGKTLLNSRQSQAGIGDSDSQGYYHPSECLVDDLYVENDTIHFHVANTFELEYSENNIFTVELKSLTGEVQTFEKQVRFIKDGMQGTIGNEWHAQILPCKYYGDSKSALFSEKFDKKLNPIVIRKLPGDDYYTQDDRFKVFLRPFVSRRNIAFESIEKQEGYFYRCYWDVRHPGNSDPRVKGSSFLRLYHTSRNDPTGGAIGTKFRANSAAPWENNGAKTGTYQEDIKINSSEQSPDGLVGYTLYPISNQFPAEDKDNETYGAVEVRFFNNDGVDPTTGKSWGTGASMAASEYRFIVKCQIDIMRGQWSGNPDRPDPVEEGETALVASIISYYPVDILIDDSNITDPASPDYVDLMDVEMNWPSFVYYDASGNNPEHESTKDLYFRYNDKNAEPVNYTPSTQSLGIKTIKDNNGNEVEKKYSYIPNPHLNLQSGFHGVISTVTGVGSFLKNSRYIKNQVMMLNLYGNVVINGWDGVGIDTNEDEGTILGAMIGAGYKLPATNSFTGVIMGRNTAYKRDNASGIAAIDPGISKELSKNAPYLTGIFGYQEGYESFGLLENGTAFFGRANGGGRIILDGHNGVIYGGANGQFTSPSIGDPMWNTMRLNLVDLTHVMKDGHKTNFYEMTDNETMGKEEACNVKIKDLIVGFDGDYFGYGKTDLSDGDGDLTRSLPTWYANMWRKAYIRPDGAKPFYLQKKGPKEYKDYEDIPPYNGQDVSTLTGSVDNLAINYYDDNWITIKYYKRDSDGNPIKDQYETLGTFTWERISKKNTDGSYVEPDLWNAYVKMVDDGIPFSLSSYGPQRASTTPAIEIGQHIHGLMPGLIPNSEFIDVMRNLEVPGDRNFMVTYDGTLWAMNAIISGNIVGSNFLGGKVMGAEVVAGDPENFTPEEEVNTFTNYLDSLCNWRKLRPPWPNKEELGVLFPDGVSAGIDKNGDARFRNCSIFGGSLDVGTFHIFGQATADRMDEKLEQEGSTDRVDRNEEFLGHLVQLGKSDFIGETHFYGDVLLGPNEHYRDTEDKLDGLKNTERGILAQTGSLALLGILEYDTWYVGHELCYDKIIADDLTVTFGETSYYAGPQSGFKEYAKDIGNKPTKYETAAVFGLLSYGDPTEEGFSTKSHLWPFHFRADRKKFEDPITHATDERFAAYVTIMNQFKFPAATKVGGVREPGDSLPGYTTGSNYFRVSPWGTENINTFIRTQFQDERESVQPIPDMMATDMDEVSTVHAYRGYFGNVSRNSFLTDATLNDRGAIGITSWNRNAIVLHSDDTSAWRTRDGLFLSSGNRNINYPAKEADSSQTIAENWGDDENYMGTTFMLGGNDKPTYDSKKADVYSSLYATRITGLTAGGLINLIVLSEEERQAEYAAYPERTLAERRMPLYCTGDWATNKQPAGLILQPYWKDDASCQSNCAKLWCVSGSQGKGGVHIYAKKANLWQSGLPCDQAQQSELFITDRRIGMMCQDKVVIGTFSGSAIVGDGEAGANVHGVLDNVKNGFGSGLIVDRTKFNVPRTHLIGGEVHVIADIAGEHPGAVAELCFNSNGNAVMSAKNVYLKANHGNPHTPGGFGEPTVCATASGWMGYWNANNAGSAVGPSGAAYLSRDLTSGTAEQFIAGTGYVLMRKDNGHYWRLDDLASLYGYEPEEQIGIYARYA